MNILEDNKIVHGLWIGKRLSFVEKLTILSFVANGHDFWLWVYDDLEDELFGIAKLKNANEIIPKQKVFCYKNKDQFGHGKGSYAGFSDIFRYKLLYEYGGWWTDMDITCLKPLQIEDKYTFRTHQHLMVVGNLMKCPPKSELMKYCYERALNEIDENNTDWHKPIQILIDGIKKFSLEKYIKDIGNYDSWLIVRKLMTKKIKLPEHWYVIHWMNEELRKNKINKNFYFENTIYGELMKKYGLEKEMLSTFETFKERIKLTFMFSVVNHYFNKIF